jgi:uncharacterized repeat protein (TIGR03803 family)
VSAQTYFDVVHFPEGSDGPASALTQASDGNFYGTTTSSRDFPNGTVFRLTPSGLVTVLHAFAGGMDGAWPAAALIQGSDGNLYGTTTGGGSPLLGSGQGTIFQMTLDGTETILHVFIGGDDGAYPRTALIQATDGNFYGTTYNGGATPYGLGTIFRMTPSGAVTILHGFVDFGGDGAFPNGLIQARDGNFYGTTSAGDGAARGGTIFRLTADGALTTLYSFDGTGSSWPAAALIQGIDGDFYGSTLIGPFTNGFAYGGSIFRIRPDGDVTTLHTFSGADGLNPSAALIQASDGSFFGTTMYGGPFDGGTVFRITPAGDVTTLHAFAHRNFGPYTSLVQATDGSLYGTTVEGMVFRIGPTPPPNRSFAADFDGDGRSDLVVYRPDTGTWFIRYSSSGYSYANARSYQWGEPGDLPLAADVDGDGKTDLVVWRPSTGMWFVRTSSTGYSYAAATTYQWGQPGDVPLAADFDGDGRTDLVVYRPDDGTWWVRYSSSGYSYATARVFHWGLPGDVPLVADVDGDHKADLVVYRRSTGTWYIRTSSSGYQVQLSYQFGGVNDAPLALDLDGDGKTDLAVWRPADGVWYVSYSSNQYAGWAALQWGVDGDLPLAADFDGDGRSDLVVWRPSTGVWYIRSSSTGFSYGAATAYQWGLTGDEPI